MHFFKFAPVCCLSPTVTCRAEELAIMFKIAVDEMVIVVVPETGPLFYRVLPDTAAVNYTIYSIG